MFVACSKRSQYRIRLQDDNEMLSKADKIYTPEMLSSADITLDSPLFGATVSEHCSVCNRPMVKCPGHYSVIQLPIPIPNMMVSKLLTALLPLICPACATLLTPDAALALDVDVDDRLELITGLVNARIKDGYVTCPGCNTNVVPIKMASGEPMVRFVIDIPQNDIHDIVNPAVVYGVLQRFHQLEEVGFAESFHPGSFMTTLIPIVPNKLRPKTAMSSESTITGYYKDIITKILPELTDVVRSLSLDKAVIIPKAGEMRFHAAYDRLMAYYCLIIDSSTERVKEQSLTLVDKRDRKHFDPFSSLIQRFGGKDKKISNRGIITTRHNVSARTVLGGAVDGGVMEVHVPWHIATRLSMWYPVYKQNVDAMRQLLVAMTDSRLQSKSTNALKLSRVVSVMNGYTGLSNNITVSNAMTHASLLKPGDKIGLSLINGDLVQQLRFPCVRDESMSSFKVTKDTNAIITIPLAVCPMKGADFDGDESNIYCQYAHYNDVESLLLHTPYMQFIAYKDGNPAIWFQGTADASYGVPLLTKDFKCKFRYGKAVPDYSPLSVIEELLPNDLSYNSPKLHIVNGKLVDNWTLFTNKEFFKYYLSLYGPKKAIELFDELTQMAYDAIRTQGLTLGYNIQIFGDDAKKRIREIMDEQDRQLLEIESSNDYQRALKEERLIQTNKGKIKDILLNAAKGTSLDKDGYTTNRQEEYYQVVVSADPVSIDGQRIQNDLCEGTRTCVTFPKHSVDPHAYGYVGRGYNSDIPIYSTLFGSKQQRFAIYQRGTGTAKQGYMSKRVIAAYGYTYADFNGAVVSANSLIDFVYGPSGNDPRRFVKQPLPLIDKPRNEIVKLNYPEVLELYDRISIGRQHYAQTSAFIKSNELRNEYAAGFDYEQFIDSHSKSGTTPVEMVNDFVQRIVKMFQPDDRFAFTVRNLDTFIYHIRMKLLTVKVTQTTLDELFDIYWKSLVNNGDPVGAKASIAITEPMTQASLGAIHKASGGGSDVERLEMSSGVTRFEELIGGAAPKYTVVTIVLYNDTKEECSKFANEQETFFFSDIWTKCELISGRLIDSRILETHADLGLSELEYSPFSVISTWNMTAAAAYNIGVADVADALAAGYPDILFISGYVLNNSEFQARIYFKPTTKIETINSMIVEWGLEKPVNVIHGKYLRNCFVCENKNNPGHYVVQANEINGDVLALENLIFDPRIDPAKCKSTNYNTTMQMYGIFESCARHYDDLIYTATNLSDTSGLLFRHYKLIADMIYANGSHQYATRHSLKHIRSLDAMRLILFETAKDMMVETIKHGETYEIADPVASAVFGEPPALGTGVSRITILG